MTAGRVGKAHGRDGSFYVERADHPLPLGVTITLGDRALRVDRRAGTDDRPLIHLEGLDDPRPLHGEPLLIDAELEDGEWLAADLLRCSVPGRGRVVRVLDGPSCSVLELEDGTLVPFVSDAVASVSVEGGEIRVNEDFLS